MANRPQLNVPADSMERVGKLAVPAAALLLIPAILLLLLSPQALFEVHSKRLYPALSAVLSTLTGWTGIPLGIIVVPILTGFVLWRSLTPRRSLPLRSRLARLTILALSLWAAYVVIWGANYQRPPLLQLLELDGPEPGDAEMSELAFEMLAWVTAGSSAEPDAGAALAAVASELERLAQSLHRPAHLPERVKTLPPGTLLRSGYAGMIFPFTLEPQVDAALTAHSRVAVGAHELAHVAGFAAEADADLAALVAGLNGQQPFARYALALSLLARTLRSLPTDVRLEITDRLPARAVNDLAEARQHSAQYLRPTLAARITAIYDRLLRGQGMTAGVADYGKIPVQAALARRHGLLPTAPPLTPGLD